MSKVRILIILFILVIGTLGWFLFSHLFSSKKNLGYQSLEECAQVTGKECTFLMCDYVPAGKTYKQVCGDTGNTWVPKAK